MIWYFIIILGGAKGCKNDFGRAGGKIILAGGKIILAGGKIILAGGKIILAGGKIILAWQVENLF